MRAANNLVFFLVGAVAGVALLSVAGTSGSGILSGDLDCDGQIGARDNQALLREVLQQPPLSQQSGCTPIGEPISVGEIDYSAWLDVCVDRIDSATSTPNLDCTEIWDGELPGGMCANLLAAVSELPNSDCSDLVAGDLPSGVCKSTIEHVTDYPSLDCANMLAGDVPQGICVRALEDLDLSDYPNLDCSYW